MSEPPKRCRRSFGFWVAVVIVAGTLYPLSFGPVCWITSWTGVGETVVVPIYRPMVSVMLDGPKPLDRIVISYSTVFADGGWSWYFGESTHDSDWGYYPNPK